MLIFYKEEYSEVWNKNSLSDDTVSSLLDGNKSRNTCECGHWDETFQPQIANIMYNKLMKVVLNLTKPNTRLIVRQ